MSKVFKAIGSLFGVKEPKADPGVAAAQQAELADQQRRSAELSAEKAAQRRVTGSARLGRNALAFSPTGQIGQTLG